MDAFRRGVELMLASPRATAAAYREQDTGSPVPCRIFLYEEPDDTGRPGISGGRLIASGLFLPAQGFVLLRRGDTFEVAGRPRLKVEQPGRPETGWEWRTYLQGMK